MAYKIKIQFRRDTAANWELNKHVVPLEGEPCFETDTGVFKIGDGVTAYGDLAAIGVGLNEDAEVIQQYIKQLEILQTEFETVKETVNTITEKVVPTNKYEIFSTPVGTLVDYREKEIRVMCPVDTKWVKQEVGENGNPNMYYMGFKAYAPEGAVSFKEDDQAIIEDQTMYSFEGNDFAGIDEFGRKYSVVWLALASYDEATDTWTYFGVNSSTKKYIGWYYSVEWYNADGVIIASDRIRINLSNEECHAEIKPFYYSDIPTATSDTLGLVKGGSEIFIKEDGSLEVNAISFSKILQGEDAIVFDGGSSEN